MFLADPPRTPYDLYFRLWGIPVRVHPLFWAVGLLISFAPGPPLEMFIRLGVWFVSILVHEMGHAWMMRYYGWNPSVTLYAMGGFARYDMGLRPSSRLINVREIASMLRSSSRLPGLVPDFYWLACPSLSPNWQEPTSSLLSVGQAS